MRLAFPATFLAGAACGAGLLWILRPAPPAPAPPAVAKPARPADSAPPGSGPGAGKVAATATITGIAAEGSEQPMVHTVDEAAMKDMMRKGAEREARREADRLALRLKLTPEQKEALRQFLTDRRMALFEDPAAFAKPGGPGLATGLDDYLAANLTPEQLAEHARLKEEEKTAKVEDYAQRKMRNLARELSLTPEQKDRVFQAFADKKLADDKAAAANPTASPVEGAAEIIASSIGVIGAGGSGIEMSIDTESLMGPGKETLEQERAMLKDILTPDQLAIYDQRRTEEAELRASDSAGGIIHLAPTPE